MLFWLVGLCSRRKGRKGGNVKAGPVRKEAVMKIAFCLRSPSVPTVSPQAHPFHPTLRVILAPKCGICGSAPLRAPPWRPARDVSEGAAEENR